MKNWHALFVVLHITCYFLFIISNCFVSDVHLDADLWLVFLVVWHDSLMLQLNCIHRIQIPYYCHRHYFGVTREKRAVCKLKDGIAQTTLGPDTPSLIYETPFTKEHHFFHYACLFWCWNKCTCWHPPFHYLLGYMFHIDLLLAFHQEEQWKLMASQQRLILQYPITITLQQNEGNFWYTQTQTHTDAHVMQLGLL